MFAKSKCTFTSLQLGCQFTSKINFKLGINTISLGCLSFPLFFLYGKSFPLFFFHHHWEWGIKSKMKRFTDKESYLVFYFWALAHKMSLEHIAEQNSIQEIDYCALWPPFLLFSFSEVPCLFSSRARFVLSLLHLPPHFTVLETVSTCSRTSAVLASPLTLPWRWWVD